MTTSPKTISDFAESLIQDFSEQIENASRFKYDPGTNKLRDQATECAKLHVQKAIDLIHNRYKILNVLRYLDEDIDFYESVKICLINKDRYLKKQV